MTQYSNSFTFIIIILICFSCSRQKTSTTEDTQLPSPQHNSPKDEPPQDNSTNNSSLKTIKTITSTLPKNHKEECGYTPKGESSKSSVYRDFAVGCGVVEYSSSSWREVRSLELAFLELLPNKTRVGVVFLDHRKRRLLPYGAKLSYEMKFKRDLSGSILLDKASQRDGVFIFELKSNQRNAPCKSHLFLRFYNSKKTLEYWLDDWLFSC